MNSEIPEKLKKKLLSEKEGISLFEYINYCLYDEKDGYYQNLFKVNHDFTTSPEISQLFGECVAIFLLFTKNIFEQKSCKKISSIFEFGPGNGTLMHDIIRTIRKKYSLKKWNFTLIEISKYLVEKQKALLSNFKNETNIYWSKNFAQSSNDCGFYLCNEFFDALPINQFSINGKRKIIMEDNKLKQVFLKEHSLYSFKNKNEIIEDSILIKKILFKIFGKIKKHGGIFLMFDYGPLVKSKNDTIQAIYNRKKCHFLDHPCKSDITHHVDFKLFEKIGNKFDLHIYGPISQSKFLSIFGINERIEILLKNTTDLAQHEEIERGFNRLTSLKEMGEIFKCMIFSNIELGLPFK